MRKNEDIWEYERRYEQSKREYLGADVLKNPGSAVVWWLARNDDQVEKAVQDIGILAQLSCAANNVNVPESFWSPAPDSASAHAPDSRQSGPNGSDTSHSPAGEKSATDHFDAFLRAMDLAEDDDRRVLFAHRVADLVAIHGHQEIADEMMHRFDTPEDAGLSWETDEGTEPTV